jgi:hypothetical protein
LWRRQQVWKRSKNFFGTHGEQAGVLGGGREQFPIERDPLGEIFDSDSLLSVQQDLITRLATANQHQKKPLATGLLYGQCDRMLALQSASN